MPCFTVTLVIGVSNWRENRDASVDRLGEGGSQVYKKHEGDPLNIFFALSTLAVNYFVLHQSVSRLG